MEQNILDKKVGNIEPESKTLVESIVTIVGVTEQLKKTRNEPMTLIKILVKHPDKPEPISISKVKSQRKDKIICQTLWVQLDEDENIQMGSAIDTLLKYFKVDSLTDLDGKTIDTVIESEDSNFLCLKAY